MNPSSTPEYFFNLAYEAIMLAQIGKRDLVNVRESAQKYFIEAINNHEFNKVARTIQNTAKQQN